MNCFVFFLLRTNTHAHRQREKDRFASRSYRDIWRILVLYPNFLLWRLRSQGSGWLSLYSFVIIIVIIFIVQNKRRRLDETVPSLTAPPSTSLVTFSRKLEDLSSSLLFLRRDDPCAKITFIFFLLSVLRKILVKDHLPGPRRVFPPSQGFGPERPSKSLRIRSRNFWIGGESGNWGNRKIREKTILDQNKFSSLRHNVKKHEKTNIESSKTWRTERLNYFNDWTAPLKFKKKMKNVNTGNDRQNEGAEQK